MISIKPLCRPRWFGKRFAGYFRARSHDTVHPQFLFAVSSASLSILCLIETKCQYLASRQVSPNAKAELCILCLPPGFPAVPHHFNLSSVGPCPSQNRACAINAHGSPHSLSPSIVEVDFHPRSRQRESFQQLFELFPRVAPPLASSIQPFV